jgi:hypothetical protein
MVTLHRGLEEAAGLLYECQRDAGDDDRIRARVELAILAVERARELLTEDQAGEILRHEDW